MHDAVLLLVCCAALHAAPPTRVQEPPAPAPPKADGRPWDEKAYDAILSHLQTKISDRRALLEAYAKTVPKLEAFLVAFPESRLRESALFDLAQVLVQLARYQDAATALGRLLEEFPSGAYAAQALPMSLTMLVYAGQAERSLEVLATLPRETPEQQHFHAMMRIQALRYSFRHDEARAEARRALAELGAERGALFRQLLAELELVGTRFPDFDVPRFGRGGERLTRASFAGDVLLVDFWATWCPPCMVELPNVKDVYRRYERRGFDVFGVSLDTDVRELEHTLERERMPWPQHCDGRGWESELARRSGVRAIPRTFLLDGEGTIREVGVKGPLLDLCVAALLREAELRAAR